MNCEALLLRLNSASTQVTLSKEEALALVEQVNFLEKFAASLLASIKRGKKQIDVEIPYRQAPA